MITDIKYKIKILSQEIYDSFLAGMDFHTLTCSCRKSGHLIKHARYVRKIKLPEGLLPLRILRVICKCCGKTHAILPKPIVPYSQILLKDHIAIIKSYDNKEALELIMVANEYLDENNIKYIVKQYLRHWRERIAAFDIPLNDVVSARCLKIFKRQFMQIKRVPNILHI